MILSNKSDSPVTRALPTAEDHTRHYMELKFVDCENRIQAPIWSDKAEWSAYNASFDLSEFP